MLITCSMCFAIMLPRKELSLSSRSWLMTFRCENWTAVHIPKACRRNEPATRMGDRLAPIFFACRDYRGFSAAMTLAKGYVLGRRSAGKQGEQMGLQRRGRGRPSRPTSLLLHV